VKARQWSERQILLVANSFPSRTSSATIAKTHPPRVLLYQESLVRKRDISRVDAGSLLFECCASVKDLVVIGDGATQKERPFADPGPKPQTVHHITGFRCEDLFNFGH
jgi:hypothetical protein